MTKSIQVLPLMLLAMHHSATAAQIRIQANRTVIVIRLFNIADISAVTLADAKQETVRLFAQAGIDITWKDGDPDADEIWSVDFSARACSEFLRSNQLLVRVIPAVPKRLPGALGMALPCSNFGPQATVFWEGVQVAALSVPASIGKVLGYNMAHEIGHVLLRSNDHPARGIMRGIWGPAEWKGVATGELAFNPEEGARMAHAVPTAANR